MADDEEERTQLLDDEGQRPDERPWKGDVGPVEKDLQWFMTLCFDIVLSVPFWYLALFVPVTDEQFYTGLGLLLVVATCWRGYLSYTTQTDLPYTCCRVTADDREIILVATLHISPRAPRDVTAVIERVGPDVVMIELDEERLDRMRRPDPEAPPEPPLGPKDEDLQQLSLVSRDGQATTMYAQRAFWNAELAGEEVSRQVAYDSANSYGLKKPVDDLAGGLFLVHRGSPGGEFAPFALKAFNAARAGASAVLIINTDEKLPFNAFGRGTLMSDMHCAMSTRSCSFPPIPTLLVTQQDGKRILGAVTDGGAQVEFRVRADSYPRRPLWRRLCQACALVFSGIGILYGIIQCCGVDVGEEFLAAEAAASARGIPCVCIDVDLDGFWQRLGSSLLPTPCAIASSLRAWLAFPRCFFTVLFPARGNVDVMGSMVLHAASFPLKTWVAFLFAGYAASLVQSQIMQWGASGAERAVEQTGAVSRKDRRDVQEWMMLIVEIYALPRVYRSICVSRDEAMYQGIVGKGRMHSSKTAVVVVGAAHSNGIISRIRAHGL